MDWLKTLDGDLFRFINLRLINPVCDAVMPFASGNALFRPLLVLAGILLIWKGRARGLLCVLMLALILPLGDGLICNTIKHAVGAPAALRGHGRSPSPEPRGQAGRPLYQHALLARGQLVRGHDDPVHLLSPERLVHAPRGDPGRLLAHLQRRALPSRRPGGSYPGRRLCRSLGLVPERALALGRAKMVSALVGKIPLPDQPVPAGRIGRRRGIAVLVRLLARDPSPFWRRHPGPALAAAGLPLDCNAACWPGSLTSPAGAFN